METNFNACLAVVLQSEGGFVDDPRDPGGATKWGVTLAELSKWRRSVQTISDVEALTQADVAPIYHADYWDMTHCPQWPPGIDLCIFDCAVNEGPGEAVRTLQQALGIAVDGLAGPATAAAVAHCDVPATIRAIEAARDHFYESLKTFPRFGKGWLARDGRTLAAALAMAASAQGAEPAVALK